MAIRGGPDIIEDGLVLHLDAADQNSYPLSGDTWYDLSGNDNHGYFVNGPTYDSTRKGNVSFDGSNDYVRIGASNQNNIQLSANFTLSLTFEQTSTRWDWVRLFGHTGSTRYWGLWLPGTNSTTYNNSSASTRMLTQSYDGGGSSTYSGSYIFSLNKVHHVVYTATNSTKKFYVNGNLLSTHNLSGTIAYTSHTGNILIGWGQAHIYHIGRVYNAMIYNDKVLTDDEILQNYNATKGRYGL